MLGQSGSDRIANPLFPSCWGDDIAPSAGQAVLLASVEIVSVLC